MNRFEVSIGSVVLKDEVFDVLIERIQFKHTRETVAKVVLRLDRIDPSRINVHWPVIVDDAESTPRRVFYGVAVETYSIGQDKVVLVCEGGERHYKERTATFGFHKFSPQEIVFYTARRVPEVQVQEKNIQGLNLNKNRRNFRVIVPILNLDTSATESVLNIQIRPRTPARKMK